LRPVLAQLSNGERGLAMLEGLHLATLNVIEDLSMRTRDRTYDEDLAAIEELEGALQQP
jgi:hypothetical protein